MDLLIMAAWCGWKKLHCWWTLPANLFPCKNLLQNYDFNFLIFFIFSQWVHLIGAFRWLILVVLPTGQLHMLIGLKGSGIQNHTRVQMSLTIFWRILRYFYALYIIWDYILLHNAGQLDAIITFLLSSSYLVYWNLIIQFWWCYIYLQSVYLSEHVTSDDQVNTLLRHFSSLMLHI